MKYVVFWSVLTVLNGVAVVNSILNEWYGWATFSFVALVCAVSLLHAAIQARRIDKYNEDL